MEKRTMKSGTTRRGVRALIIALVVAILCVAVNIAVVNIPTKYTKYDMSEDTFITLSDQTKQILANLDTDITLYWLVTAGSENETIGLLLDRYADETSHITVEKVDLTLNPEFGQQYTSKTIYENGVVVDAGDKAQYVSYYKIYQYDDSDYYNTGKMTITFEGESQITNAIHYCTTDVVPTVYTLVGHGEEELGDDIETAIANENLVLQELNLVLMDAVPEDCSALIICSPSSDISEEDAAKLHEYLKYKGNLLLITDNLVTEDFPNLLGLMESDFGIGLEDGIILEGDEYYYISQYPYYLIPELHSHTVTDPLINNNYFVLVPFAQPLKVVSTDEKITVTSLFTTTESSYCKADGFNLASYQQEDDDLTGPFTVGCAMETTSQTKAVWITSYYFLNSTVDSQVSGGNTNMLLNTLSWMCGQSESISIRLRVLAEDYFTASSAVTRNFSLAFVVLIPVCTILLGVVIWVRRRRR